MGGLIAVLVVAFVVVYPPKAMAYDALLQRFALALASSTWRCAPTPCCVASLQSVAAFAAASLGTRGVLAAATRLSSPAGAPRQAYVLEPERPVAVAGGDMRIQLLATAALRRLYETLIRETASPSLPPRLSLQNP